MTRATAGSTAATADGLWDFSLAFYAQPGVAEACIGLQDEYGLDVNVVLCALYAGLRDIDLDRHDCAGLERAVRAWRRQAVVPLRKIRRSIRSMLDAMPDPAREAYEAVKQAELTAERAQQARMEQWLARRRSSAAPVSPGPSAVADSAHSSGQGTDDCCAKNLEAYLCARRCARDAALDAHLRTLQDALRPPG